MTAAARIAAHSGGTICEACGGSGVDSSPLLVRGHGLWSETQQRPPRRGPCETCRGVGHLTAEQLAGLRGEADPRPQHGLSCVCDYCSTDNALTTRTI
mgnify:CR=1 FL=1